LKIRFPALIYSEYRPYYPEALFILMARWLKENGLPQTGLTITDVGCGTGHSTHGLVHSGLAARVFAVDPDREMLNAAKGILRNSPVEVERRQASGEKTGLFDRSVDVVLSASAFHWMNRDQAVTEFLRILKKPGLILMAEYGFPQSSRHTKFNTWIRSQLTGPWQIPELTGRISFADMVSVFGQREGVRALGNRQVPMKVEMSWQQMYGFICSQSRYVRTRESLATDDLREQLDRETAETVRGLLGGELDHYDFGLQASGFLLT
jgi:SAM-dependent methyltransferase